MVSHSFAYKYPVVVWCLPGLAFCRTWSESSLPVSFLEFSYSYFSSHVCTCVYVCVSLTVQSELLIQDSFQSEEFVTKLVHFFSQEVHKGRDVFDSGRFHLFKVRIKHSLLSMHWIYTFGKPSHLMYFLAGSGRFQWLSPAFLPVQFILLHFW